MIKPIFNNDIAIFHEAASKETCENLIYLFDHSEAEGTAIQQNDRNDFSKAFKFTDTPDLKKFKINLIDCLQTYAKKYRGLHQYGLVSDPPAIQSHSSVRPPQGRVLVWMLYLNTLDADDGTTEFLYQHLEVQPTQGTILIWPAYFNYIHRGNPPRKKIKYISTGWWEYKSQQHPYNELKTDPSWMSVKDYFLSE
ncbi:MAG: 2OG-Fe(II) oxygenase [Proteobacteria bacterium]|nr:2OG-Fe(II) oxygenase [Pseudomonadota bacterium]